MAINHEDKVKKFMVFSWVILSAVVRVEESLMLRVDFKRVSVFSDCLRGWKGIRMCKVGVWFVGYS